MTALLPNVPYWQPALGELGQFVTGLDDLAQAIRIILATPKGSLPHRPDFGCSFLDVLDMPQGLGTARIIREVMESVARYEPRVKVSKVQVDTATYGLSVVTVYWVPQGDTTTEPTATTVSFDANGSAGAFVPLSSVGVPGGVAPLNTYGIVPPENLPGAEGMAGIIPVAVDGGEVI
ncbi:protein 25-like lysozyme [mine drainage metagenome]|uniref:Protein 25-like lysozyme n=1 Tax=mine drainage metagenome TaxID=410659 RepID=A0A1J5PQ93_9ZZZZ